MGDGGSKVDGSDEGLSAALVDVKGSGNKRKFASDAPIDIPADASTMASTVFPRYENLIEELQNDFNESSLLMEKSEGSTCEEQESGEFQQAEWDDPVAGELEELLTNHLLETFCSAVKCIVECGHTEEDAKWAVINCSLCHGMKDPVTNTVDSALALLQTEKESGTIKNAGSLGLPSLVNYLILEMIHVLCEVKPDLTIAEAMWLLLMNNLNLYDACTAEGDPSVGYPGLEAFGESMIAPEPNAEASRNSRLDPNKSNVLKQPLQSSESESPKTQQWPNTGNRAGESDTGKESTLDLQEFKRELESLAKERILSSTQSGTVDDKSVGCKKGSSSSSKRDILRQKTSHFEKNCKGRVSKGLKAKVVAWENMLEKSTKSQSGPPSTLTKGTDASPTTLTGSSSSLLEVSRHESSDSKSGKDPVVALPAANSNSPVPDSNPTPSSECVDYCASIPYDKNLQKYIPQDSKEKAVLMLVAHEQALEKELQGWMAWANEKIMQAAKRLVKEKEDLKKLRQEKEEMEKLKKEREALEESTKKRLLEMEHALSNMTSQIQMANCTVRRLEAENAVLKKESWDATFKVYKTEDNLDKALKKEAEALNKCRSCDSEKVLLQRELASLKREITDLKNQLEKARARQDQFKALFKHEEKEKAKVLNQVESIREEKEKFEVSTKEEEENIKQRAETNLKKCREDIENLENRISQLRLEFNKSKIAALSVGYGNCATGVQEPSMLQESQQLSKAMQGLSLCLDDFGSGGVKPERECVMCMIEEISVVFLPCAHQVLCRKCSDLHEKQGMNDCPSCRTMIQTRIQARYDGRSQIEMRRKWRN